MPDGSGGETTQRSVGSRETLPEHVPTTAAPESGSGTLKLQRLLSLGSPAADKVAQVLGAHPGEREQMLSLLHATLGNAYVQSVLGTLGQHVSAPIQLNPNAPPRGPLAPVTLTDKPISRRAPTG
jgi:hypothetical protein